MSPDPVILDELVRRIVEASSPYGSFCLARRRGARWGRKATWTSWWSCTDGCDRVAVTQILHGQLSGLGVAKDIVVVQASDVERYGRNPYLIIHSALSKGRELYHAAS